MNIIFLYVFSFFSIHFYVNIKKNRILLYKTEFWKCFYILFCSIFSFVHLIFLWCAIFILYITYSWRGLMNSEMLSCLNIYIILHVRCTHTHPIFFIEFIFQKIALDFLLYNIINSNLNLKCFSIKGTQCRHLHIIFLPYNCY